MQQQNSKQVRNAKELYNRELFNLCSQGGSRCEWTLARDVYEYVKQTILGPTESPCRALQGYWGP